MAILDDSKARRCAKVLEIRAIGTIGLVLIAKQQGIIPSARPAIEKLISVSMYLAEDRVIEAFRRVGE